MHSGGPKSAGKTAYSRHRAEYDLREITKTVEIRKIRIDRDKAPFSGQGICVVLKIHEHSVELLYPFTFEEFWMPRYDRWKDGKLQESGYESSSGERDQYWPTNTTDSKVEKFYVEKMVALIYRRVREQSELHRTISNIRTIVKVLSELSGSPLAEVELRVRELIRTSTPEGVSSRGSAATTKAALKLTRRFRVKSKLPKFTGRRGTIIEVMRELGDASMLQIIEASRDRVKTKVKLERVVTFFVNDLVRRKMAVELNEQ